MRELPELWTGVDRIQWGCALMQLLGESDLTHLPLVLSGLRSVERSPQVASHTTAVHTTRELLGDLLTKRSIQSAVADFLWQHREEPGYGSFDINPDTLAFTARSPYDPELRRAERILRAGLPVATREQPLAPTDRDLVARLGQDRRLAISFHGIEFPPPTQHDLGRRPIEQLRVTWGDLEALASELDREDEVAGRRSQIWVQRLANSKAQVSTGAGLRDTDTLDLTGLRHLIGLPGSGKTTLISLLCVLLARRGLRVAVFFTAIQVAREYLETLRRYGVRSALLVGRSSDTHLRHANELAELVAARGNGGFGHLVEGVDLLAQACPLPAFAPEWPKDEEWSIGDAPCESIFEARGQKPKLCPAWSLCGRVRNQRELVEAEVWLGHIRSADTYVPAHTSREQLRYFELAARTFDLVIVDEVDEAQRVLDEYGTLTLQLTGNDDSVHAKLNQITSLLAANRRQFSDRLVWQMQRFNVFDKHLLRFLDEVRRLQRLRPELARDFADKLLTTSFLLRQAARAAGREQAMLRAQSALTDLWDTALYAAFYERDRESTWRKAREYAPVLGLTETAGQELRERLKRLLVQYLSLDHPLQLEEPLGVLVTEMANVLGVEDADLVRPHVRLLVVVGFTIASYQWQAKGARTLAQRGEVLLARDLVFAQASPELRGLVPRSILGTFSAVRYRQAPDTGGLELDYVVMDSAPRLLLHRLHERGGGEAGTGAHVLLASATSWLDASSMFHVGKAPDIVLSARVPQLGSVRLHFSPKLHPVTREALAYSGSGPASEGNLRAMVRTLAARGQGGSSELERVVRAVRTPLGKPRKAALVVNSYEQVRWVVEELHATNRPLAERTRGVIRDYQSDRLEHSHVLRGQVEALGADPEVDVLVFPLGALGRGVNIVFPDGDEDRGRAAVGSVYFLTRPHPAAGDLSLMLSLLAQRTERMDREDLGAANLAVVQQYLNEQRYQVFTDIAQLLTRPMSASQLSGRLLPAFAANLLVSVLQTIGRGMRNQMPVEVYFVDAAWARHSARGVEETPRTSMLVAMRDVLDGCLSARDPDQRDIYEALYGVFARAFRDIEGVRYPEVRLAEETVPLFPSPAALEDAMDDWEPGTPGAMENDRIDPWTDEVTDEEISDDAA